MGFSRQKHWSGLPFPPPGDLPNPGIEPVSLTSPAGGSFTTSTTWEAPKPTLYLIWFAGTLVYLRKMQNCEDRGYLVLFREAPAKWPRVINKHIYPFLSYCMERDLCQSCTHLTKEKKIGSSLPTLTPFQSLGICPGTRLYMHIHHTIWHSD